MTVKIMRWAETGRIFCSEKSSSSQSLHSYSTATVKGDRLIFTSDA